MMSVAVVHPWAKNSKPVYVIQKLDFCFDGNDSLRKMKEVVQAVLDPLFDALQQCPYFFAKYSRLITHVNSPEMKMCALFKTLLDKPQYFKNSFFISKSREDLEKTFGKRCLKDYDEFLSDAREYPAKDEGRFYTYLQKFMRDGRLPANHFDSQSYLTALYLIVDEKISDVSRRRLEVKCETDKVHAEMFS